MSKSEEAYKISIKKGEVRIVINIEDIDIEIENSATEFIDAKEDTMFLHLGFSDLNIEGLQADGYELHPIKKKGLKSQSLELKKDSIWFDVDIDKVSGVLNNTIQFHVEGNQPKFISYYIKKLYYKIEWLQYDKNKDSISTVSVTKKTYSQPRTEINTDYSIEEISRCAELLGRAIKKIDLRTGTAFVKLNTEEGKLDPVLITIGAQLGYQVEVLGEDTISDLLKRGQKATHLISLILNY